MANSTKLSLPLVAASQAQKHVTVNEALIQLDAIIQLAVISQTLTAPPGSPAEGDRYIIAPGATGAWSSKDGWVACWADGVWRLIQPSVGWVCYDLATSSLLIYSAAEIWVPRVFELSDVLAFGADPTGQRDSIGAFEAAAAAAGVGGAWTISSGKYLLSRPFETTHGQQQIVCHGGWISNTFFVGGNTEIQILGVLTIDPQLDTLRPTSPDLTFGFVRHRGQRIGSTGTIRVKHCLWGVSLGGTAGGQVTSVSEKYIVTDCAYVGGSSVYDAASNAALVGPILPSQSSTLVPGTITNGGSGYVDGRWVGPLTTLSGTVAHVIGAVTIVGGVVTEATILFGGRDATVGDTLSFNPAQMKSAAETYMGGSGSGFVWRADSTLYSTISALPETVREWSNQSHYSLTARDCWAGGYALMGHNYFTLDDLYLEHIAKDTPYLWGQVTDCTMVQTNVLVNGSVGTVWVPDAGHPLINFGATYGTSQNVTMIGGRVANTKFSAIVDPKTDLVDLGPYPKVIAVDFATLGASTRAESWFWNITANNVDTTGTVTSEFLVSPNAQIIQPFGRNWLDPARVAFTRASDQLTDHQAAVDLADILVASATVWAELEVYGRSAVSGTNGNEFFRFVVSLVASRNSANAYKTAHTVDKQEASTSVTVTAVTFAAGVFTVTWSTGYAMTTIAQWSATLSVKTIPASVVA
ncbi:hypothetical protein [Caudoviricetes sp.]|nr:hypothetical protein [Caudoviricetes sp.]